METPIGLWDGVAKPRDIMIIEVLRGIDAIQDDVLSEDTITAARLQVRLTAP